MVYQKRAPSIDMTSIELHNVSPAPTYSSTFHSRDAPIAPQHAFFSATPKSGVSNNPYFQTSTTKQPPLSMSQSRDKAHLKEEEDAEVNPDYQDPNHPHYAGSTGPNFPTALPARNRIPRKRVLIPSILGIIVFLIALWLTSIWAGVRFLNIIRPIPTTPNVQEINVYINGEVFQGSASMSVSTATATTAMSTTSTKVISFTPKPNSMVPTPGSSVIPDMGNDLGVISKNPEKRLEPAPTGFMTVTRRIP
jgi:hypothetical protein